MYQEFKKKEDAQKVAKEGKYYTFNLDTFRIFSIGSFFLFIVSLIFLFGYWLGSLSINLNSNENLTSSIQNEKVLSKVPSPEQSVINLSDDDQQVKIQEPKESSSFIDEKFQDLKMFKIIL